MIPSGWLLAVGMGNSVTIPAGVNLTTLLPLNSVNQMLPSWPAVIPQGWLLAVGIGYSVVPAVGFVRSNLATLLLLASVNQMLPSGPVVIPSGPLAASR